ncbi:MAG: CHAT domain-containing protein [Anaerolineae bacterium]|nr:CHAT domain-containing protein [Anaerolineae bacterium]
MTTMNLPEETFTDLAIQIERWDEARQCYPTEAVLPNNRFFGGGELRLDFDKLISLEGDAEAYGLELFYALFSGRIREAYDRVLGLAEVESGGRVRVRLGFDPRAPELPALAWERLHYVHPAGADPLTVMAVLPFSRQIRLEEGDPDPLPARPLRLLFAIANPSDLEARKLAPLQVEAEIQSLRDALDVLLQTGQIEVTLMPGRTGLSPVLHQELARAGYTIFAGPTSLTSLSTLLSDGKHTHILHFLGHGRISRRAQSAGLFFEDANGATEIVKDEDLVGLLSGLGDAVPRLIFLASCESAKRVPDQQNPFVGLSTMLGNAGVPAIVAMQDYVAMETARVLSQVFYTQVLDHGIVDKALNQARHQLYVQKRDDWAVPVLTMRLQSGKLFMPNPARAALVAAAASPLFNPLPSDDDYLPLEALYLSEGLETVNLDDLIVEQMPCRDMVDAVLDIFAPQQSEAAQCGAARFVALVGASGMGKSMQLLHIGKITAMRSLEEGAKQLIFPVYVDLLDFPGAVGRGENAFENLVMRALRPFWQERPGFSLDEYLASEEAVLLRVIVDGSESLPDHVRRRAWSALRTYCEAHPRYQYIVTSSFSCFDPHTLPLTDVLVMRSLSARLLERFLSRRGGEGQTFYIELERAQLLDLAGMPWLLFKMLAQKQQGDPPRSHTQVLRKLVEDTIADIASDQGMRAHAAQVLYTLAWRMQSTFRTTLPIDEAFEIFAEVRGKRGYSLEAFFQELEQHELLTAVGDEGVSFGRPHIQAYCTARALSTHPKRERLLDDITATLGRRTRYRWWHYTLMLLSGMLADPCALVRKILYGVALSEGEQVFLAVSCIQESRANRVEDTTDSTLLTYVLSALIWRLDSAREPNVQRRIRVIEALGQLQYHGAIPHLIKIVQEPVRRTPTGQQYEHSNVRLAAVMALRHIVPPPYEDVGVYSPVLLRLLNYWLECNVDALEAALLKEDAEDESEQAVAAFALGEIQTEKAIKALVSAFLSSEYKDETYKTVATALTQLDPGLVTRCVILPLLDPEAAAHCELDLPQLDPEVLQQRERWHEQLAHLIGHSRTQSEAAREFLYWCLYEFPDVELKLLAIQSLGLLYDLKSKSWLENIALGQLDDLDLPDLLEVDKLRFELAALDALYYVGDEQTLEHLQVRPVEWTSELDHAFYRTSEEILSRRNRW